MFRGFYAAASGMLAQQRRQDVLTNNLANINTPGYKQDQAVMRTFPKMLIDRIDGQAVGDKTFMDKQPIGELATGVYLQETIPSFVQGSLKDTGMKTDIALIQAEVPMNEETGREGAIFFKVENENGEVRYTRNGHFTVDTEGNLVTQSGHFVLDTENNRIQVESSDFHVDETGVITDNSQSNMQINIAYINNPTNLVKEGNGLLRLENGQARLAEEVEGVTYQLKQGFIERSNVDLQQTRVNMLNAYRNFEANQKVLQAYDRTMDKAVNEIGRIG